jgi:DNA-binding transcriptional LysR family regulator
MSFTLRQIAYFAAAAEHGSVSAAAKALAVSQPSVSAAIAELETQFGVQLLVRHHAQGVAPTPAGREVLAEARELLAAARGLEARAKGLGQGLEGTLDVGCFITFAPVFVPGLLAGFKAKYPGIAVRLREGHIDEVRAGLESGAQELALMYDMGLGTDIATEPLTALKPYAVLPQRHRLARSERVSLKALAAEPLILLDLPASREYFLSLFLNLGIEPRVGFRTSSYEMVRGMVANGHGYALLNTEPATDITYDGLKVVNRKLAEDAAPTRIVLARLARSRPTRMAEAFAAFAKEHFSPMAR